MKSECFIAVDQRERDQINDGKPNDQIVRYTFLQEPCKQMSNKDPTGEQNKIKRKCEKKF